MGAERRRHQHMSNLLGERVRGSSGHGRGATLIACATRLFNVAMSNGLATTSKAPSTSARGGSCRKAEGSE